MFSICNYIFYRASKYWHKGIPEGLGLTGVKSTTEFITKGWEIAKNFQNNILPLSKRLQQLMYELHRSGSKSSYFGGLECDPSGSHLFQSIMTMTGSKNSSVGSSGIKKTIRLVEHKSNAVYHPFTGAILRSVTLVKVFPSNDKPLLVELECGMTSRSHVVLKRDDDLRIDVAVMNVFAMMNTLWAREKLQVYPCTNPPSLLFYLRLLLP